jgi:hypothetical protein
MPAVAQQSYRVTFDPRNLDVMAIIRSLSTTQNVEVEKIEDECPYDPAYVEMILKSHNEPRVRVDNLADVWKL